MSDMYTKNQPIGSTCDENAKVVKGHCGDSPDDCNVCLGNPCQCQKEVCCICGEFAEEKCSHCKNPYCLPHFKSVVMTGNCCSGNEKDYEI